jgi:hypothetical protein
LFVFEIDIVVAVVVVVGCSFSSTDVIIECPITIRSESSS